MSEGVKMLIFGPPKRGKTRMLSTASETLILSTDSGCLSLDDVDTPVWDATNADEIDEFFAWFTSSNEAAQFKTLAIDDLTALAVHYLNRYLESKSSAGNQAHGQKAYGSMAEIVLKFINYIYFKKGLNVIAIAKEERDDTGIKRPLFPGRVLPYEIPHKFDTIAYLDYVQFQSGPQTAIRTKESIDIKCGSRLGHKLDEFEPCHVDHLIHKQTT